MTIFGPSGDIRIGPKTFATSGVVAIPPRFEREAKDHGWERVRPPENMPPGTIAVRRDFRP